MLKADRKKMIHKTLPILSLESLKKATYKEENGI